MRVVNVMGMAIAIGSAAAVVVLTGCGGNSAIAVSRDVPAADGGADRTPAGGGARLPGDGAARGSGDGEAGTVGSVPDAAPSPPGSGTDGRGGDWSEDGSPD